MQIWWDTLTSLSRLLGCRWAFYWSFTFVDKSNLYVIKKKPHINNDILLYAFNNILFLLVKICKFTVIKLKCIRNDPLNLIALLLWLNWGNSCTFHLTGFFCHVLFLILFIFLFKLFLQVVGNFHLMQVLHAWFWFVSYKNVYQVHDGGYIAPLPFRFVQFSNDDVGVFVFDILSAISSCTQLQRRS